jgi:hypothetical protein
LHQDLVLRFILKNTGQRKIPRLYFSVEDDEFFYEQLEEIQLFWFYSLLVSFLFFSLFIIISRISQRR